MRVLIVNMTLDPRTGGGTAVRAVQCSRALADLGVECEIATTGMWPGELRAGLLRDVSVVTLPAMGGRFRVPYGGFRGLRDAVKRADVVLLMNHWTAVNVLAWKAARSVGRPHVVCPANALPLRGRSRLLKMAYHARWGRRLVFEASAHVATTAVEVSDFAAYGVARERVVVVPNGLPSVLPGDAAVFRGRHGFGEAPLLLFLGRLAPIKGPDLLVAAFARAASALPGWHLVLAGPDDGMWPALRDQIAASGVADRVHAVGFLDEGQKADALAACELLVVPSRSEVMSIAALEAAAAGRPVLVTDRCGAPVVT